MKMLPHSRVFYLLFVGLTISGCATLDKNECLTVNWESIGYEDGARGYTATRIGKHRSACAKHGVTPDLALYTKGREHGLVQYCRASAGYRAGVNGRSYKNVCPATSEREFLEGYRFGKSIYSVKSRVRDLRNRVKNEEKLLDDLVVTITETELELIQSGVSRSRRALLLLELKELSDKKRHSEVAIAELYDHINQAQHRMRRLQASNPYEK